MVSHERTKKKGIDPPEESLIPCRECSTLAMILLDDIPLCKACVIKATADRELDWIIRHSRPLGIMGPIHVRDRRNDGKVSKSAT